MIYPMSKIDKVHDNNYELVLYNINKQINK